MHHDRQVSIAGYVHTSTFSEEELHAQNALIVLRVSEEMADALHCYDCPNLHAGWPQPLLADSSFLA